MNNLQFLHAMFGGKNGGVNIASPCTTGDYDYIIVESGVTFTVLADAAKKRIDVIHLSGTKGTATILCDAVSRTFTKTDALTMTAAAAAFVTANAAAYLAAGTVLTSVGDSLIFTAGTAGTDFTGTTSATRATGNIEGFVELRTANHAAVNLLTGKNLTGVAFTSDKILSAGSGNKIATLTFSGGLVWGYTLETSTI